jgi:hypothetical protein
MNLRWNSSDYGGVKDLRIPPHRIWKPDVLMYNRYVVTLLLLAFYYNALSKFKHSTYTHNTTSSKKNVERRVKHLLETCAFIFSHF